MSISIENKTYKLEVINSYSLLEEKICTPECQRHIDENHVNEIYEFEKKHYEKYEEFFFINPITICILNDKKYIIDGQHRLACIRKLYNENKSYNFNVYLTNIFVENIEEMEEKYTVINKNKPVQLFSNIEVWKLFYKKIESYIIEKYKNYLSDSLTPQVPNFNIKYLLEYLDTNEIAIKLNYNSDLFISEFEKLNNYYKENISILSKSFNRKIDNYISKSQKKQDNYLLLSLFRNFEWVDRIVYIIENNSTYEGISHYSVNYRVKILKKLRRDVWEKRNKNLMKGECFCCSKQIEYDNFQCGHIKSVFFRGETILSNLEPICSCCNRDMGVKDLHYYKNELEQSLN